MEKPFILISESNMPATDQLMWLTDGEQASIGFWDGEDWMGTTINKCEVEDGVLIQSWAEVLDFVPTHYFPTPDFSQFTK